MTKQEIYSLFINEQYGNFKRSKSDEERQFIKDVVEMVAEEKANVAIIKFNDYKDDLGSNGVSMRDVLQYEYIIDNEIDINTIESIHYLGEVSFGTELIEIVSYELSESRNNGCFVASFSIDGDEYEIEINSNGEPMKKSAFTDEYEGIMIDFVGLDAKIETLKYYLESVRKDELIHYNEIANK